MSTAASRIGRKTRIALVLFAALVVETDNLVILAIALDPGPADPRWFVQMIQFQAGVLHAPAFIAMDGLSRHGFSGHDGIVIMSCGYLTTALLFFSVVLGVQRAFRSKRTLEGLADAQSS